MAVTARVSVDPVGVAVATLVALGCVAGWLVAVARAGETCVTVGGIPVAGGTSVGVGVSAGTNVAVAVGVFVGVFVGGAVAVFVGGVVGVLVAAVVGD